jgi:hypothetical protein
MGERVSKGREGECGSRARGDLVRRRRARARISVSRARAALRAGFERRTDDEDLRVALHLLVDRAVDRVADGHLCGRGAGALQKSGQGVRVSECELAQTSVGSRARAGRRAARPILPKTVIPSSQCNEIGEIARERCARGAQLAASQWRPDAPPSPPRTSRARGGQTRGAARARARRREQWKRASRPSTEERGGARGMAARVGGERPARDFSNHFVLGAAVSARTSSPLGLFLHAHA